MLNKRYTYSKIRDLRKVIEPNDLLVVRVGRNAGSIIVPNSEHLGKPTSYHLMIAKNILDKIELSDLKEKLLARRKGLTAKYISKFDLSESIAKCRLC